MREFFCVDCGSICMGPSGGGHDRSNKCGCVERKREADRKEKIRIGLQKLLADAEKAKRRKKIKRVLSWILFWLSAASVYPVLNYVLTEAFPFQ